MKLSVRTAGQPNFLPVIKGVVAVLGCVLLVILGVLGCAKNYPAEIGPSTVATKPGSSTTVCPCSTTATTPTAPGNTTTSSGTGTTTTPGTSITTSSGSSTAPVTQTPALDTLNVPAPRFSPNGGNFHMSVLVKLTADQLPAGAVIEYSPDNGDSWKTGQQFTLTTGGKIITRIRSGTKLSPVATAQFSLYFERMMVIGNSIMSHAPAPEIGWLNFNGMAASAPEKDFVHLLTARLQALYPPMTVRLQSGGDFERYYGTPAYNPNELLAVLQQVKPDLIIVRIGENVDQGEVTARDFESHYRQLLNQLATYGQPVRIVCTTSVWWQSKSDPLIRKITAETGITLVDLDCIVGQGQYFASQYKDKGVAEHPNDVGMQLIADMIWSKIQ